MSGRRARRERAAAPLRTRPRPLGAPQPTPLGLVSRYLTMGDLLDDPPPLLQVATALRQVPVETALTWIANMLAPSAHGVTWREHQVLQAHQWFPATHAFDRRALELVLSGQRVLLTPQVLLVMARLACVQHPFTTAVTCDPDARQRLRRAMLTLAHHLGAERRAADTTTPDGKVVLGEQKVTHMEVAMVANELLNRVPYPLSFIDRFERRWRELPLERAGQSQIVDLASEYEQATGVALADLVDVAFALWTQTTAGAGPLMPPGYLDHLGRDPQIIDRVLSLIADTPTGIADRSLEAAAGELDAEFDTALFGQTPLIRLHNGGLLVISPILLMERAFGWLPYYDLKAGFKRLEGPKSKRADRSAACLRRTTELHAVETLTAVAHATPAKVGRVYGEVAIQRAYGTVRPNADAACAWPGHWVVAEVSARQTPRTVAGATSAKALLDHLDKGAVKKARQLEGTIAAIRDREGALTGEPTQAEPRRFWPLLIVPDGFPATPMTTQRLRRMLHDEGLLQGADTADLVIVDAEALEILESVGISEAASLPELLTEHAASPMAQSSLKNWFIETRGSIRPALRIRNRWTRSLVSPPPQRPSSVQSGVQAPANGS